ncbi:type II toxin-antitoxin system RelE/ParE family toxin [Rhodocyclus tenuis]|uniref:Type II toxin-antitoxin system RelE/ParE family toxin n=1 Tax=Rhodocyclus gracilis TaxID=2929842 RepID=A0ABX0WI05_9RHOO|nr:type II toxin-antitoxin system RelE/ParE family toxin [Rhodocyclus gracilis]MRD72557.1 type II toxin-antitoxin system RelE/ParE family toxin [Rhodocyclus gracilis]NJA88083.1 type II toxin-antitoxin system RelE/ParE family toxin [Rhodocyclus gracilis]
MKAVFLKAAQAELDAAVDYYADHASDRVAEAFLQDALQTRQRLIEHPEIGNAVSKRLRTLAFKHFPYSLIYRFSADAISIHAVAHQRRRPGYWTGRR